MKAPQQTVRSGYDVRVTTTLCLIVLSLIAGSLCTTTYANPSSKSPFAPLNVHGTIEGAESLAMSVSEACELGEDTVLEMQANPNDLRKFSANKNAKTLGLLWKAGFDARQLELMGEPFGYDMSRRVATSHTALNSTKAAMSGTREGMRSRDRVLKKLARGLPKLNKFLEKAEAALSDGKVEAVHKELMKRLVDIATDDTFLTDKERKRYTHRFFGLIRRSEQKINVQRREEYIKRGEEKALESLTTVATFDQEAARLIAEFSSSPQAIVATKAGGEPVLAGPVEAFDHLTRLWGDASAGVSRAYAFRTALHQSEDKQSKATVRKLRDNAVESLARLIVTAGRNIAADQVPNVHPKLVERVVTTQRRMTQASNQLTDACEEPLKQLASMNPTYSAQVERYQRVAQESLRWRKMFADLRGKALESATPSLGGTMASDVAADQKLQSLKFIKGAPPKKVAPTGVGPSAALTFPQTDSILLGQLYHDKPLLRLSATSRVAIVPCDEGHYVNVVLPIPSDAAVKDLMESVLVSEDHPALSYQASNAVSSAKMHDYQSFAGVVQGVHLEGAVTRFITLSDAAYVLAPLGKLPEIGDPRTAALNWCWRFDMKPVWVRNEYFTVGGSLVGGPPVRRIAGAIHYRRRRKLPLLLSPPQLPRPEFRLHEPLSCRRWPARRA